MKKINLGIIFGGQSAEHEISLLSARNIIAALNKDKYNCFPIGLKRDSDFYLYSIDGDYIIDGQDAKKIHLSDAGKRVSFSFGKEKEIIILENGLREKLDVVFPVLHGSFGEDGTVQGLLEMAGLPYVGTGVFSSAAAIDKEETKKLLLADGIKVADHLSFSLADKEKINFDKAVEKLGLPFFVKPATAGSSVGVARVKDENGFKEKVSDAFKFSHKILLERAVVGREIECSVLGNEEPKASLPGEIIPNDEFYSYQAKYLDEDGAKTVAPADLPEEVIKSIQEISIKSFLSLDCQGMARVDGFLKDNGEFIVNELNTIPGFTSISMYPKLWEVSGLSLPDLLDKLIELAIERFEKQKTIKLAYNF